mmetsp:Transcript_14072/g.30054  ORF Transcript_14072/g.30054 Transcript_14072/m.30054 type:complete len:576 (-) Transcript_14072:473-2200(-)
MTSPPPKEPTTAIMTMKPSSVAFPSDATPTSITTDFLALVGFAARLGTCVNNDASSSSDGDADGQDAKSVRDEAMLLMSLLMGKKAEEILSEEIGAKESRCQKRKTRGHNRPKDRDMGNFSFTFPSLSLQPDAITCAGDKSSSAGVKKSTSPTSITTTGAVATPSEEERGGGEAEVGDDITDDMDIDDAPPPSKLLSRTQSVSDKDAIRDSSEAMAHNVLESFGAALVWRAKIWIKSLANVLALKEQERINALKAAAAAAETASDTTGEGRVSNTSEMELIQDDKENDDLMNSKEMQIIDAIVRSSEEVSVVNIKTAFRVLPNRMSQQNANAPLQDQDQESTSSPKKKARSEESPPDKPDGYKVTHKLMFEATISMTSNDGVRYNGVKLQAPGYIQGTFTLNSHNNNKSNSSTSTEGEETLEGVYMTLDTDALAQSLERQSRLVVRRAAEAALVAASGVDVRSSPHYMESPHVHHSIISPRYVLMSPVPAYPSSHSMTPALPPVPSVNDLNGQAEGGDSSKENEAPTVSSSESHSSDSSAVSATTNTPVLAPAKKGPAFPALLSVANDELIRGIE